ncbi:tetratricopeptide repeat protein [Streptomyces kanamyceticus]|uniref:Tetratricopeptide repeat protein n=1 Tax=Streptomyces kanamyceticus TaxID=1967 RepID=A0A5J6GQZ3_STRKN|nr:tetratricopeptide repeat protein [Streptomyces kanamyceticus]QEU96571.1 tetratricopeptide repeat protein [Streptomyces kanamyceticus]
MSTTSTHLWLTGPESEPLSRPRPQPQPPLLPPSRPEPQPDITVDCHRRLRGPYTGAGGLLRALLPLIRLAQPELPDRHRVEIHAVAPELRGLVADPLPTLTDRAAPAERTRLHPRTRTRRLAHGIVELLLSYARAADRTRPLVLGFTRVTDADPADQEFLALLLRRAAPDQITLVVHTRDDEPECLEEELASALRRYASRRALPVAPPLRFPHRTHPYALVRAFVASDGTSTDPAESAAYERADEHVRARLHDARATELHARVAQGELTLGLGALPYHLERGSDPAAAAPVLASAAEHALATGCYHALLDLARRAQAVTPDDAPLGAELALHTKVTTALALLGDTAEAERLHLRMRERHTDPLVRLLGDYALAMLHARFHPPGRRDLSAAKALLTRTVALAARLPDPGQRAFHTAFQENGLALIELRLGHPADALRLIESGLGRLRLHLPDSAHLLHRSVLLRNRAEVYAALGHLDAALADHDAVVAMDPHHPEHYFDRADVRRRLGDTAGALTDYDRAIDLAPPHWELHFNRADLRLESGDTEGALADLRQAAALEPDRADIRASLVGTLLGIGDLPDARAQVTEGLRHHPDDAHLLCERGLIALREGADTSARADFDRALALAPHLVSALAGRATLAHAAGDDHAAVADLTRAITLEPSDPDLLYNRGYAHQQAGRVAAAHADYTAALRLPGADVAGLRARIEECDRTS